MPSCHFEDFVEFIILKQRIPAQNSEENHLSHLIFRAGRRMLSHQAGKEVAASIPGSHLHIYEKSGHAFHCENLENSD